MKILFVILHGLKNKSRYFTIKNTWGKDVDLLFYSDYEDLEKNIIKVSNRTDYHSNEEKHINILKFLENNHKNYDWFFFCDDDTFVNTKKLIDNLENFDSRCVNGSVINCWPKDFTLNYCSGGAGYLIHRSLLDIISKNIRVLNSGYSDVTLGLFLRDNNIKSINYDWFNTQAPNFYGYDFSVAHNYITFHYIKTEDDMINLLNFV